MKSAIDSPEISEFISQPERLDDPENLPFDLFWSSEEVSTLFFDTIIVRQVRVDDIQSEDWLYSASSFLVSKEDFIDRVFDLSLHFQKAITDSFRKRAEAETERSVQVFDEPPHIYYNRSYEAVVFPETSRAIPPYDPIYTGGRTLLVEAALSEVTFGDPILYAGLFAVPVPGIANMSTALRAPSLLMKARFVDSESGEVIMELVDRRFPQLKIVDLNRLVVGYALEEIADSFAEDLAHLFFLRRGDSIQRRSPVSLFPW